MDSELTFFCFKWGNRYSHIDVNRIYKALLFHQSSSLNFICFTDCPAGLSKGIITKPLPEIVLPQKFEWTFWRKLSMFDPNNELRGKCVYLDIDIVISGSLSPLFDDWRGEPRFIRTWVGKKTKQKRNYDKINSSVMLFSGGQHKSILDKFYADQERILSDYPGDQGFIHDCLQQQATFFREGLCVSFKKHCIPRFPLNFVFQPSPPKNASVVIFHGKPDPKEAILGSRYGSVRKWHLPFNWDKRK